MKLLIWHCTSLRSRDIRKSNRPAALKSMSRTPVTQSFNEVVAAFVCVERDDIAETATRGAQEIRAVSELVSCREIVLVPFAHLSSELMTDSRAAQALLALVADQLEADGLPTTVTSFGYHKEFELHFVAKGHPGAVAFRDVSPKASRK